MIPGIARFFSLGLVGCVLVTAAACRDAPTTATPAMRTRLVAASSTSLTGTVGAVVDDEPSVVVQDSSGRPVAGVVVTFTITDGGGALGARAALSGSDGLARLGTWGLGTVPGRNALVATNPSGDSIVFVAEAAAGPPSRIEKVGGDGQAGQPAAPLANRPRVKVTDLFENPLAGVTVTFAVEAGGGSLSRETAVTDADGIAESGDWVLGTIGAQRMVARAGSLVAEPFAARVIVPPAPCTGSGTLQAMATTRAELSSIGCNVYTISVPAMAAYRFTAGSPEFGTNLQLRAADLTDVAGNDNIAVGATMSAFTAILTPGTYKLYVASSKPGTGGVFDVAYSITSGDVDGCDEAFVVRGIIQRGVVNSLACAPDPFSPADRFRINVAAGQSIDMQVEDFSYSGPNIRVIGPDGHVYQSSYTANYVASLSFTAPADGYYLVLVGLVNEMGVQYELRIR